MAVSKLSTGMGQIVHHALYVTADSTHGFADTGISSQTDIILCAYRLSVGDFNEALLVSNLNNGNYRVQLIDCTTSPFQPVKGWTGYIHLFTVKRSAITD